MAQDPLPFSINYDPLTGRVTADQINGNLRLTSKSGIFTGQPTLSVYEFYRFGLEALLVNGGEFGPIATTGLTVDFLKSDLCIRATTHHRGSLGPIRLNGEVVAATGNNSCPFQPDTETPIDPNTPLSASGERRAIIAYDAATGAVRADVSNPQPQNPQFMRALEIVSRSGIFTGEPSQQVETVFDVDADSKLFVLRLRGVQAIEFGNVAKVGLSNSEVANDLCVSGAWLSTGGVTAEYLYPGAGLVPLVCSTSDQPADVGVKYDAATGDLVIDVASVTAAFSQDGPVAAEKAEMMTTLEVRSASGVFTGTKPLALRGPYDIFEPTRVLKQNASGFETVYMPGVIATGLTRDFLLGDLEIDITTLNNRRLGAVAVQVTAVPEPVGGSLTYLAIAGAVRFRRRNAG